MQHKILLTRPVKSSQKIAKILTEKNLSFLIQPLFSIIKNKNLEPLSQMPQAVLITSSNAVFALKKLGIKKDILILVVGKKTADSIKKTGYKNVVFANNSATSLLELAKEKLSKNSAEILYLSGSIITIDLAQELLQQNYSAKRIIVYGTKEVEEFSKESIDEIGSGNITEVWIYSKNSEKIFYKLAEQHNLLGPLKRVKILYLPGKDGKNDEFINY
ncbi:MAG: uroporphyrinogen-III synthase [Rickettsiaceae bacterium]|jgi:uroporphyrinogen-III synthase|nr:uroporphyrinogen-III synthase [Rickettsiaceae bacterium]